MRMSRSPNLALVHLDPPGPWTKFRIADRTVYMRVDVKAGRAAVRYDEVGAIRDLGVICDISVPGGGRFVPNPHQSHWAASEDVGRALMERARVLWRRQSTDREPDTVCREAGGDIYELWADLDAGRVEINRRPREAGEVVIEEYIGYADRLSETEAQIHLREAEAVPYQLRIMMRALACECWRDGLRASTTGRGKGAST